MKSMRKSMRMIVALLLVPAFLQGAAASDDERGWSFSQRFQGNSNSAGIVLKTNSTLGYSFNSHLKLYGGLPVYFAREATSSGATSPAFMNGIGNAFTGLLFSTNHSEVDYSSDLVVTAPTGDKNRGFSTGHATVDWTNTFSHSYSSFTPYASIGAANTISDTAFFVRPFASKGIVAHFEGGALIDVLPHVGVGASGYGIRAAGEQQIISKVVGPPVSAATAPAVNASKKGAFETQHETVSTAEIANDHGFSTWLSLRPGSTTDFLVGYSRSATYGLNSLFFGMGFRVGP
jgi:hypothetical protein